MGNLLGIDAALNFAAQENASARYLKGVRETNEMNAAMAHQQNYWNVEQWNRTNEYNKPVNQLQRLKEAGLSDSAAAQSVSGVPASPLQSADLSVYAAPQPTQAPQIDLSGFNNIIGLARQIVQMKGDSIDNEMKKTELDSLPTRLYTEQQIREQDLATARLSYKIAADEAPYSLAAIRYDVANKKSQKRLTDIQYKNAKQNWKEAKQRFDFMSQLQPIQIQQAFANLAETYKDIDVKDRQVKLADQEFWRNNIKKAFEKYGGVPDNFIARLAIMIGEGIVKPEDVETNIQNFIDVGKYIKNGIKQSLPQTGIEWLDSLLGNDNKDPLDGIDITKHAVPQTKGSRKMLNFFNGNKNNYP